MDKDGVHPRDIAAELGRTEAAVRYKLAQLWKDSQALNGGPLAESVGAEGGQAAEKPDCGVDRMMRRRECRVKDMKDGRVKLTWTLSSGNQVIADGTADVSCFQIGSKPSPIKLRHSSLASRYPHQIRQDRVNVLQRRLGKNKVGYRHRLEEEK
jgi:hypothetical protein